YQAGTQLAMAQAAEALGLTSLAIWILDQACVNDSRDYRAHRALGRLHEQEGEYQQAIGIWEAVSKALPFDGDAQQKLKDLAAHETIARGRYVERMEHHRSTVKRATRKRSASND